MAAVVISQHGPTGSRERNDANIVMNLAHAVGVDSATIALTLTGPQGVAHSVIAGGVFATTSGWYGRIVADGTGFDVVVSEHSPLMAGQWSASATADSTVGGEDGTLSWAFQVVSTSSGILEAIKEILEGTIGTGRTISTDRFVHVDFSTTEIGAIGASGPARKFDVYVIGKAVDPGTPSFVSGDYVHSAKQFRISVAYASRPNAMFELEQDKQDDDFIIRRALEWPENWCLTKGWTGAEITAVTEESISSGDETQVVIVHYDLIITLREYHG